MEKNFEIAFVSNRCPSIVDLGDIYYVYLPMSEEQASLFGVDIINPCARFLVKKQD